MVAAAHLIAAYAPDFPDDARFCCVVDPGVGSPRLPIMLEADGRWFVAPDNGLLSVVAKRAGRIGLWEITWRPERLSASFHGRDLFAPVTAWLALGRPASAFGRRRDPPDLRGTDWPEEAVRIIYIDGFGNAITGLLADRLDGAATLVVNGRALRRTRVFSDLAPGQLFWYENANGLVEIAQNQGRAADSLKIAVGDPVSIQS